MIKYPQILPGDHLSLECDSSLYPAVILGDAVQATKYLGLVGYGHEVFDNNPALIAQFFVVSEQLGLEAVAQTGQ